eukprot:19332-Heterococcus_DN1.PRE.3
MMQCVATSFWLSFAADALHQSMLWAYSICMKVWVVPKCCCLMHGCMTFKDKLCYLHRQVLYKLTKCIDATANMSAAHASAVFRPPSCHL